MNICPTCGNPLPETSIPGLDKKPTWRLKRIREKYRLLQYDSHEHGSVGGDKTTPLWKAYHDIVEECDRLLREREEK